MIYRKKTIEHVKGQLGVPLTVYPWYLLCSTLGFLGIITHKYPRDIDLYRAYIGISHRGTLPGVHPTILLVGTGILGRGGSSNRNTTGKFQVGGFLPKHQDIWQMFKNVCKLPVGHGQTISKQVFFLGKRDWG